MAVDTQPHKVYEIQQKQFLEGILQPSSKKQEKSQTAEPTTQKNQKKEQTKPKSAEGNNQDLRGKI